MPPFKQSQTAVAIPPSGVPSTQTPSHLGERTPSHLGERTSVSPSRWANVKTHMSANPWTWVGLGVAVVAVFQVARQYWKIHRFGRQYRKADRILGNRSKSQKINMTWLLMKDNAKLREQLIRDHDYCFDLMSNSTLIDYKQQTYLACNVFMYELINLFDYITTWKSQNQMKSLSNPFTEGEYYFEHNNQLADRYQDVLRELQKRLSETPQLKNLVGIIDQHQQTLKGFLDLSTMGVMSADLATHIREQRGQLELWTAVREYQYQLEMVNNYRQREVEMVPDLRDHLCLYLFIRLFY